MFLNASTPHCFVHLIEQRSQVLFIHIQKRAHTVKYLLSLIKKLNVGMGALSSRCMSGVQMHISCK